MKTIKDFIVFTNLHKNRIKLTSLLILMSVLYSLVLSFVHTLIYMGNLISYYAALYMFVIWTAFIFMIIIFMFIQKKRGMEGKLPLKSSFLPLFFVQSIFYILMLVLGVLPGIFMLDTSLLTNGVAIGSMLFIIFYIPWQIFCFIQIYDGEKNPFKILWNALTKIMKHYQSCFYSLAVLVMIALFYYLMMNTFFNITNSFSAFYAVQEVMISSNPFSESMNYLLFVTQNQAMWAPAIVSLIYGVIMCGVLVYYYMFILCVYDEDVKV